jgi:hypothetical protein
MKYLLTIFVLATSVQAFAQFTEGDKVLGGTLWINSNIQPSGSGGVTKSQFVNIVPSFGTFVNSSLEVGGQLGYSASFYRYGQSFIQENKTTGPTVGIYARKYFPLADKFFFSLQGAFTYSFSKSTNKSTDTFTNTVVETETTRNTFGLSVYPQFIFFPSANWGLQAGFGSIGYTFSRSGSGNQNQININHGQVGFGISYYFRKAD